MKRLIAILAISAMATTAAFAQVEVSGYLENQFNMFMGNFSDDDGHVFGGNIADAYLQMSATNGDGNLGALLRMRNNDFGSGNFHRAFVWWRPVESVRLFLGQDPDGQFAADHFMGWGFHQGQNDFMFNHDWDFWGAIFGGGFDQFGLAVSFENVVDGLDIHLALPTGDGHGTEGFGSGFQRMLSFEQLVAHWRLRVNYNLSGLGSLSFAFNAPGSMSEAWQNLNPPVRPTTWEDAGWFGQTSLSFHMTGLDFGNLLFGFSMDIADPDTDNEMNLRFGAGATIPGIADLMELRVRVGLHSNRNTPVGRHPLLSTNIMPIIPMGPGSLMFDVGMSVLMHEDDFDAERHLGWWIGPVYRIPIAMGSFQIGVHLRSGFSEDIGGWDEGGSGTPSVRANQAAIAGQPNNDITFNIPMVLTFSF